MSTNPDYKDVKEMYELLGGKSIERPQEQAVEGEPPLRLEPVFEETETPTPQKPLEGKVEEAYPTETEPQTTEEEEAEETPEQRGENISFL